MNDSAIRYFENRRAEVRAEGRIEEVSRVIVSSLLKCLLKINILMYKDTSRARNLQCTNMY